ncbi:MAG: hypothetical protein DDT20_00848 [Firmicutes bacterium]|nr:hypothetical protein [Bacillota bacterium]
MKQHLKNEIERIRHGYDGEVYDERAKAMLVAYAVSKVCGYCFAVQGRCGWYASLKKPLLRGARDQVIECSEGRELLA